jgi:hypothetical protein
MDEMSAGEIIVDVGKDYLGGLWRWQVIAPRQNRMKAWSGDQKPIIKRF